MRVDGAALGSAAAAGVTTSATGEKIVAASRIPTIARVTATGSLWQVNGAHHTEACRVNDWCRDSACYELAIKYSTYRKRNAAIA